MNVHNAFLITSVDRKSLQIALWIANMLTSNCLQTAHVIQLMHTK